MKVAKNGLKMQKKQYFLYNFLLNIIYKMITFYFIGGNMFKVVRVKRRKKYNNSNKIFIISLIKIDHCLYNLKYILDNKITTNEYLGYFFFDVNIDNMNFIQKINPKMIGKWLQCDFDFYNVLLGLHNKR